MVSRAGAKVLTWVLVSPCERDDLGLRVAGTDLIGGTALAGYGLAERSVMAALPYVALNPVRARLVARAEDWRWSSVHALLDPAHCDGLIDTAPVLKRAPDFAALLCSGEDEARSL